MTKEGQRKFLVVLFIWLVGLIVSKESCGVLASLDWISRIVPAIESFKLAASPENSCIAAGIWAYAWLVLPIFLIWMTYLAYKEPVYERSFKQRGWGLVFTFGCFLAFFLVLFYGTYGPYPGTDKGRWATLYRESEVGVIVVTAVAWVGLYVAFSMSVLLATEILGIKQNRCMRN